MKKIIKMMGMIIGVLVVLLVLGVVLFVNLSPQLGGVSNKERLAIYENSKNYKDGKFLNQKEVKLDMSMRDIGKSMVGYFIPQPKTKPDHSIPVEKIDSLNIVEHKNSTRLVWFGHSTFLVQMNNKNILIDPMLGDVPAPNPLLGSDRFSEEIPIEIEKLPKIDAVLISHDHYDHLDYGSIKKLKSKVDKFYTPLGVGVHLEKWGVERSRIVELDWWQEVVFEDLTFKCTPAQHFSGRGLSDRAKTLWSSWVIQSETENIFFSGDSGYGPHFKEIGDKYGPFDFAMMECGQYNEMWPDIHMFPEETAQAAIDIKAKQFMPIHWGAFKLAMHSWTEPVERIVEKSKELNLELIIPKIGESIVLGKTKLENNEWWK